MLPPAKRVVEAADRVLRAAIGRGPACPLMAYVLERFGQGTPTAIRAQLRTMLYYYWCVGRAFYSYTHELEINPYLQAVVDRRLQDLIQRVADGDEKRRDHMLNELRKFFDAFDTAMHDTTVKYGWVTSLGQIVVGFISDGEADPDLNRQAMCIARAPARTLTEIHRTAASILNESFDLKINLNG